MQIASEEIFTRIKLGLIMIGALFIRRHLSMSWKYILVPYYVNIVGINCGIIAAIVKALSYIEHACIEDVDYSYFSPYLG